MADTFDPRFYNTGSSSLQPSMKDGHPYSGQTAMQGLSFSSTIAVAQFNVTTNRYFCFPLPGVGTRRLHGFWISAADFDSGGPTLDMDLVLIYAVNGVEVVNATPLYQGSTAGQFSAVIAMKWVDKWLLLPQADNGIVHVALRTNTAATTAAAGNLTLLPRWM